MEKNSQAPVEREKKSNCSYVTLNWFLFIRSKLILSFIRQEGMKDAFEKIYILGCGIHSKLKF